MMEKKSAFTLIEMTVVIAIILIIMGISITKLSRGGSHHEAKFSAHTIQSFIMHAASLAKSAGKVYIVDGDANVGYTITDPTSASSDTLYRFSILRIYSATFDESLGATGEIVYSFEGETYEIPFTIGAYTNADLPGGDNDYVYIKPDGSISSKAGKLLVCPENKISLFYSINLGKVSGNVEITSYKD